MITTTFRAAPGISVDLPGSSTAKTVATTAIHVIVMSEDEIYVDNAKTNLKLLSGALHQRVAGSDAAQIKAVLEARSSASYQLIISVLDAFRANGVGNVGLATRREKAVQ
jgi:biopolymer transport protein ExbD